MSSPSDGNLPQQSQSNLPSNLNAGLTPTSHTVAPSTPPRGIRIRIPSRDAHGCHARCLREDRAPGGRRDERGSFLDKNPNSSLKRITFVVYNDATVTRELGASLGLLEDKC